jgi:hypothetical protein
LPAKQTAGSMEGHANDRDARLAGVLYLISVVGGIFTLRYVPDRLVVSGDPVATAHNIAANPWLLRWGIAGDLAGGVIWLFVVLVLYRLLKDVDRVAAGLMVVLGAFMQVPLYFVNVVNYMAALMLATGATFLSALTEAERDALVMLFLKLHHYQLLSSLVFAGLWLFPFGILVYKSGFLPRVLGVWLLLGGVAWLAVAFTGFLAPQYSDIVDKITQPMVFGEIATMLWLLIFGARRWVRR